MKKSILLFVLFAAAFIINTNSSAQSKLFFETGVSAGMEGASVNFSVNTFNKNNFIAGVGLNVFGVMNYNGFLKPDGENLPFIYLPTIKSVEERGPYGAGAGIRILSNYGIAIEGGAMGTWESKYTTFTLFGEDFKYAWTENEFKIRPYARIIVVAPENKFTFGFGTNAIEKFSLYLGFKFGKQ